MATIDRIGRLSGPLAISCLSCGRRTVWSPVEAQARLGGECTTIEAKRRLRCAGCGEDRSWRIEFSAGETAVSGPRR